MEDFQYKTSISTDIFDYYPPTHGIKGLLSIPHSGLVIPQEFSKYLSTELTSKQLNQDVDFAADQLVAIEELQQQGIAVLVAKIHRVCIDLNRSPDTAVFPWKENSLGVAMIIQNPSIEIQLEWITKYHTPYFSFLNELIFHIQQLKMGMISLVDLHSMPSHATPYHLKKNPNQSIDRRKDFCVSDLQGLSCQRSYINGFCDHLSTFDWNVAQNDPYFGGYITQYMDTTFRCNVIQCEINRDIYMCESEKKLIQEKVDILKPQLTQTLIEFYTAFNTPFTKHQIQEQNEAEKDEADEQFAFAF